MAEFDAWAPIEPAWLRDGVRFWLSHHLTYDVLTWTSCLHRARLMAAGPS